jgi:ubiquinone/menaquinone biosynthesis C-methylase UbiE
MTQKIQEFWDKNAKKYSSVEKQYENVYKDILAKTGKYLDPDDNVLDFGCATGTKTLALASKVKQIRGLDISAGMITEALKKKDESNVMNATFSQGTIFNTDLGKESFDKIITYEVLHLLEDHHEVIRRIYELLKPGGLFISLTACFKDKMTFKKKLEVMTFLLMKRLGLIPLHLNRFKADELEGLLSSQGFEIIESEKIFHGMTNGFIVAKK